MVVMTGREKAKSIDHSLKELDDEGKEDLFIQLLITHWCLSVR